MEHKLNERGSSLVTVLISVGLLGLLAGGFATVISNQAMQQKKLDRRAEMTDTARLLRTAMMNLTNCVCQLNGTKAGATQQPRFNKNNNPASMNLPDGISMGCAANSAKILMPGEVLRAGGGAKVKSIKLDDIKPTNNPAVPNQFLGTLRIDFESDPGVGTMRPIEIPQLFSADVSNPSSSKVVACQWDQPTTSEVCSSLGGVMVGQTCSFMPYICASLGGTLNGVNCTLPTPAVPPPVVQVQAPQVSCSSLGGTLVGGICTFPTPPPSSTPNPPPTPIPATPTPTPPLASCPSTNPPASWGGWYPNNPSMQIPSVVHGSSVPYDAHDSGGLPRTVILRCNNGVWSGS